MAEDELSMSRTHSDRIRNARLRSGNFDVLEPLIVWSTLTSPWRIEYYDSLLCKTHRKCVAYGRQDKYDILTMIYNFI